MRVLALEPFYGGSHRAFLDGWAKHSAHEFTILHLPPYKWKWRMRHAAVSFAQQLHAESSGAPYDVLWCSDMLNLAEFLGLAPSSIGTLPRIIYFHENQLTYPVREELARDLHFAFSNYTSCLAADQVWFNSHYHQDDFLGALRDYLKRMPDYQSVESVDHIREKSKVQYPAIHPPTELARRVDGELCIAWNARWEHDKNPDEFFLAMRLLKADGIPFRLIVLGESFRNSPAVFRTAQQEFAEHIDQWGYVESEAQYRAWLSRADFAVSTATHEFFGMGIVEALAAGAIPLVPNRLAYPEVLSKCDLPIETEALIYGQTAADLVATITRLANAHQDPELRTRLSQAALPFTWTSRTQQLDDALQATLRA